MYDYNNREMHRPADGVSHKDVRIILISNIIQYIVNPNEIQIVASRLLPVDNQNFDNIDEFEQYLNKYIQIENLDYRFSISDVEFIVSNNKGYIAEWIQRHMDAYRYPGKYNDDGELMD